MNVSGAYGAAVLYRKKDDDSLVILKEISLHDLTATERQMAMNEVCQHYLYRHSVQFSHLSLVHCGVLFEMQSQEFLIDVIDISLFNLFFK